MEVAALNSTTTGWGGGGGDLWAHPGVSTYGFSNYGTLTPINVALSPGHSLILSRSRGEKSGEGMGSKLCHGLEMVDLVSTNQVHHFRCP